MSRSPLRIATTPQLEKSARIAGFDVYLLPELPTLDFNRSIAQRIEDGKIYRPFLQEHKIELVLDYNTSALTLVPSSTKPGEMSLTTADLGIPYIACYLDPVTSTMAQVSWADHWQLLESATWVKWIPEVAHSEELLRLGVPNIITMPMSISDNDFDTTPPPEPQEGPLLAFMGHPASSWFRSGQHIQPAQLLPGLTAAAVRADMPDMNFHKIYFDLYEFAQAPTTDSDLATRAQISGKYFNDKFTYNAYLAIKQRDRFARFLKTKLGDSFELIGDHWMENCGLEHTPRIWDGDLLRERMRNVPICLNLIKGNWETGLITRHFEITANGGFMLTYPTAELSKHFEVGKECDVFRNEEELLHKIDYYLTHQEERRAIAEAGQRRTLSEHLLSHRIVTLVTLLRKGGMLPSEGVAEAASLTAQPSTTTDPLPIAEIIAGDAS